jgi:DNA anti-recombination protein RmuC
MPLDDIGKRLDALLSDVAALTSYVHSLQTNLTSLRAEVQSGFKRVDEELNAAKIRDQEVQRLLKFSLHAGEGLRESVETRFDESDVKQDEQIDLLKQVVRQSATPRTGT